MKLVEQCSKSLCKSDATLLDAEVCHDFLINSLNKMNTNYARVFAENVKKRVLQRRTNLSDIVCFLSLMPSKLKTKFNFYSEPSDEMIKNFIQNKIEINSSKQHVTIDDSASNHDELSLGELLKIVNNNIVEDPKISDIDNELLDFRQRGVLGNILKTTLKTLLTIAPTSVQCERIFSSCSRVITKFRSSMLPEFLNCIIFIKMLFRVVFNKE